MDPGHHTVFLLAILICILLLLLAVSSILMCYLRRNGFKMGNKKSLRFGRLARDQATSMTSFALKTIDSKCLNDPKKASALSLPITMERSSQSGGTPTSCLYLDNILNMSGDDENRLRASEMVTKSVQKISEGSGGYTALRRLCSSGASIFGSVLEKTSGLNFKEKRQSSSPKSGVDTDILMIPLESPVYVPATNAEQIQSISLQRDLSCSSTVLCENSSDQQFTWDASLLSILSDNAEHKESCSVPSTLERKSCTIEESFKQNAQLQKPHYSQPKSWFIYTGSRPVSDGVQLENKELDNVTSLDSGVDIIEVPGGNGFRGPKMPQGTLSINEKHLLGGRENRSSRVTNGEELEMDPGIEEHTELHISHQEAARKLNPGYYRSLWERWEERPLIGVN